TCRVETHPRGPENVPTYPPHLALERCVRHRTASGVPCVRNRHTTTRTHHPEDRLPSTRRRLSRVGSRTTCGRLDTTRPAPSPSVLGFLPETPHGNSPVPCPDDDHQPDAHRL